MVELESDGELTRSEIADFLREFAHELDIGSVDQNQERVDEREEGFTDGESVESDRITFIVGGDSATVTVPDRIGFDVEVESRSPMLNSGVSQSVTLDLSWEVENPDDTLHGEQLEIE